MKADIVLKEQILLRCIGFKYSFELPYAHLLHFFR